MNRNPWGPPERAAAREEAIYDQFEAEIESATRRFPTRERKEAYLYQQFGNPAVKAALEAALMRRRRCA